MSRSTFALLAACLLSATLPARQAAPKALPGSATVKHETPSPDPVDGDSGSGGCSTLCPYDCTYEFKSPLNHTLCLEPIVSCGGGLCVCRGQSPSAPVAEYGQQHSTRQ